MLALANIGTPEMILILMFSLIIPVGIFLIFRQLMLWYWRVNEMIDIQKNQTALLQRQIQLLEEQNQLLKVAKN